MTDPMFLRVAKVLTFAGSQPLTNASGFFYLQQDFLYLITARHVVIDEAEGHHPDRLRVSLHADAADLQQRSEIEILLYRGGVSQWFQHPRYGNAVDVAAVAVNEPHLLSSHEVSTFKAEDVLRNDEALPLGQGVLILGFPLGFHDTWHNLSIVRSATIASSFAHPFKGQPYFLTDARLHRGMSGSPVIARIPGDVQRGNADSGEWRLLGIHTSALDVSDRDPVQDERLALNTAWYASLIAEMLPEQSAVNIEKSNCGSHPDSEVIRVS